MRNTNNTAVNLQAAAAQQVRIATAQLRAQGISHRRIAELSGCSQIVVNGRLDRHKRYAARGIDPTILPPGRIIGSDDITPDPTVVKNLQEALAITRRLNAEIKGSSRKRMSPEDDPEAERIVAQGRKAITRAADAERRAAYARRDRDRAIVALRDRGYRQPAIAAFLGISLTTVQNVVKEAK